MKLRVSVAAVLLVAVNAALLVMCALQLSGGSSLDSLRATAADTTTYAPRKVPVLPAVPDLESIQNRSLFYRSRVFFVAAAPTVVEQPPPDYRLAGSMLMPNQPAAAMLVHNQSGARLKVVVGAQVDGWTVSDVGARRVALTLGERTIEITSAAPAASVGMSRTTAGAATSASSGSSGMVRVLGAGGADAGSTVPSSTTPPPGDAARLYRPPRP